MYTIQAIIINIPLLSYPNLQLAPPNINKGKVRIKKKVKKREREEKGERSFRLCSGLLAGSRETFKKMLNNLMNGSFLLNKFCHMHLPSILATLNATSAHTESPSFRFHV